MRFTTIGVLGLVLSSSLAAQAQGVTVLVDGTPVQFDQPPVMEGGRVLVPMRGVFERLGASVVYVPESKQIRATHGNTMIDLTIGSRDARISGRPAQLDMPASTIGGRTVVPLRFISESLGADVRWDAPNRTVSIKMEQTPVSVEYKPPAHPAAPKPAPKPPAPHPPPPTTSRSRLVSTSRVPRRLGHEWNLRSSCNLWQTHVLTCIHR